MNPVKDSSLLGLGKRVGARLAGFRIRHALSLDARSEMDRERRLDRQDISIDVSITEALAWIGRAQDNSTSADGGVARHYCLVTGWGPSYPECTGYIIPTLIREGRLRNDPALLERAWKMLDWLISIQNPSGGFQAGTVGNPRPVPCTFNTGQILLGLAAGVSEFGPRYRPAMLAAADWLVSTQDRDGCWRGHPTPFAAPGEKTYETHVAWGLFEAARVEPNRGYEEAAMRNLRWALGYQSSNGWFAKCCLLDSSNPLTHTLGYALRGLISGYEYTEDAELLLAACKTAEGLAGALQADGFLPGRLDSQWRGKVAWSCLTGTAQIAACWLLLYRATGAVQFRKAAVAANRYVRSTVRLDGPLETRGAVKGSFPVSGDNLKFQYPDWACKFLIDANRLEKEVCEEASVFSVSAVARAASNAD